MSNTPLTVTEQIALRQTLESGLMKKAVAEVLRSIYISKSGAATLEQCAMAHNYTEGARAAFNTLFLMAEMKEEVSVSSTRRFRPTKD